MSALQDSLIELIRRTSAEIPDDVHQAILPAHKTAGHGLRTCRVDSMLKTVMTVRNEWGLLWVQLNPQLKNS